MFDSSEAEDPEPAASEESNTIENHRKYNSAGASWLAMAAVLSLPALAIWSLYGSAAPDAVREFRLVATLIAIFPFTFLLFLRQSMVDRDHLRLLGTSQTSLENLKRLQSQFAQAERLASLGQLAAGAAHEINNPLTAILGFSDLLADDVSLDAARAALMQKWPSGRAAIPAGKFKAVGSFRALRLHEFRDRTTGGKPCRRCTGPDTQTGDRANSARRQFNFFRARAASGTAR